MVVRSIILLLVLISASIALWLTRTIRLSSRRHVRIGLPSLAVLAAAGALFLWLNPQLAMGQNSATITSTGNFTFGPYPTEERLAGLKEQGYTIISLLHPAVIPFEPKLLRDERKAVERVDMELIHIPMLPWVSDNEDSLERIRELAANGDGRYYVHCYLGRDRVAVVKRIVEQTIGVEDASGAQREYPISIRDKEEFERGPIYEVADRVFLAPYPTDEEFFNHIVNGPIEHVVSLLDPKNPDDVPWIEKEQDVLASHRLPFDLLPVSTLDYDPEEALAAAEATKSLPRPVVIHGFLSPSLRTEAFLQSYRSGLPALPPSRFNETMARGKATVVAPNIAIGPRPLGPEFGNFLARRGVHGIVYMGGADTPDSAEDRASVQEAGLSWETIQTDTGDLFDKVKTGGPWYIYGPLLGAVEAELNRRFGPAIPSAGFDHRQSPEPRGTTGEPASEPEGSFEAFLPDTRMLILLGPVLLLLVGVGASFFRWLNGNKLWRGADTRLLAFAVVTATAAGLYLAHDLSAVTLFGATLVLAAIYRFSYSGGSTVPHDYTRRTAGPRDGVTPDRLRRQVALYLHLMPA